MTWRGAWYPCADGALWIRPADGLAVAPGEGSSPEERLAAGSLPRAEAHGAAWRAVLAPYGRRKPAGALLAEAVLGPRAEPARRAARLGSSEDGAPWPWPEDDLAMWAAPCGSAAVRLDRAGPRIRPGAPALDAGGLEALARDLRGPGGAELPPALAGRLAADAARGCLLRRAPAPSAGPRAGWGRPW